MQDLPSASIAQVHASEGRANTDILSYNAPALTECMHVLPQQEQVQAPTNGNDTPIWRLPLRIVIQVVGSRGDVQPFIAIGNELAQSGHSVRIATHDVFKSFVEESGIEFYPIGGDPADLMSYMVKNPSLIPSMKTVREGEIQRKRKMMKTILEGCWRSCTAPSPTTGRPFVADAIIANPPAFAHIHCAQALGVPLHLIFTMPWRPTNEFLHPLANIQTPTPNLKTLNYVSFGFVQSLTWQGLGDVINEWRYTMDLEAVPLSEGPFLAEILKIPTTYCWSPALVPKPNDWPSFVDVCGFVFREPPQYAPPPSLQAFLAAGSPPIYVGFGSIVIEDPEIFTDMILEAVQICGVRTIMSRGWSKLGRHKQSTDQVFYVDDCPHEWLFQQVSTVVHHGGAGTTACGLRCGKPTVIVPFFGDQPFWGNMVAAAGAGPEPLPFKDLAPQRLAQAIRFALQPQVANAALNVARVMREECGVKAAVDSFHRNLQADRLRCDVISDLPAVWQCRAAGKYLKLSGIAAEKLVQATRIKSADLQIYRSKPFTIDNRRWEPASAAISSVLAVPYSLLGAANEIWKGPQRVRQQAREHSNDAPVTAKQIGEMAGASLMSIPYVFDTLLRGFVIDLPLAMSEGLRATPRLYGEEVEDHETISDVSSGAAVARKEITEAFTNNTTGGWFGKRLLSTATRASSACIGLVAYPAQGLYKSAYVATHSTTTKNIVAARAKQQRYDVESRSDGRDYEQVIATFDELCR